ncbi:MAG: mandelate racemase/muconate lactonizing enzyme family protein, partial [Dehalococcoidia bacterium]
LHSLRFTSVPVTARTEWVFAEITDDSGLTEVIEITSGKDSPRVIELVTSMVSQLRDQEVAGETEIPALLGLKTAALQRDRPLATALSALRTALIGLQARHQGVSLVVALGGAAQESIPLYANINRSLLGDHRTPTHFAAAAEQALRDGFTIIKCAPFDDLHSPATVEDILEVAKPGIDRVAAVRAVVGPEVRVLVDCHSRFEAHTAPLVAEQLARLDVGWFEEPVSPTEDLEGLAQIAGNISMPTAGGEAGYGADFFADLIESKAVNVIMPDPKFCGGVAEATKAGRAALQAGGNVSLHCPAGPVSQLASAQVTAALPGAMPLEHAVNEASWRKELMQPPERIEQGRFWFPSGTGIGAALDQGVVRSRGRQWTG